jgi:geranylgeranyl diphosphate synthase type II
MVECVGAYDKAAVEAMLRSYADMTQRALTALPSLACTLAELESNPLLQTLHASEQYSLMAGGKRIRPALVLEVCRMLGGEQAAAQPLACAVEMIHTYSLIHDDLPCMDNDDLRRGKPTNHKVYGEAIAMLAGDGLLTDAFGVIASDAHLSAELRLQAVGILSSAAGSCGMVGGQLIDLENEKKILPQEQLCTLHRKKTGALFRAALLLGATAAGKTPQNDAALFGALTRYAEGVGLAFQIVDDVLDVSADPALLGKTLGKDAAEQKNTFLNYYSVQEALARAAELTEDAVAAIAPYPCSERLQDLARYLKERNH